MKTFTRRIIAVGVLLCVAMSGIVGCSSSTTPQNESTADESAVLQIPFTIDDGKNAGIEDPNGDLGNADPTESASSAATTASSSAASSNETATTAIEETTEIQTVTNADGQPVTEVVTVTDAKGAVVTDAKGSAVTSIANVTTVVRKTTIKTAPANNTATTAVNGTEAVVVTNPIYNDYKASTQTKYAMWLDISKDENFYFEGDFITVDFKVKEGIPDGDYKIQISPDLSDIAGKTVHPGKVIDGIIRVNNGSVEAINMDSETADNVYYGDQIACKQGDTITFNINVKNNTGIAAFFMWFYYDSNALEMVSAKPCGEFATIAKGTEFGSPTKSE